MKRKIIIISIMLVVGVLMHFVCDIFPQENAKKVLGILFPINETSWEHMKLIWYPFLGAGIYLAIKDKNISRIGGFTIAGFVAIFIQLGIFSFYQSLMGRSVLCFDITFYLIDMILCALLGLLLNERAWVCRFWYLWIFFAVLITAGIIVLTYIPGDGYLFYLDYRF